MTNDQHEKARKYRAAYDEFVGGARAPTSNVLSIVLSRQELFAARLVVARLLAPSSSRERCRRADHLALFAEWVNEHDDRLSPDRVAVARFLASGPEHATKILLAWRGAMAHLGLADSTAEARLDTMRWVARLARDAGVVSWSLPSSKVKAKS